jgi:hypothetical protein
VARLVSIQISEVSGQCWSACGVVCVREHERESSEQHTTKATNKNEMQFDYYSNERRVVGRLDLPTKGVGLEM